MKTISSSVIVSISTSEMFVKGFNFQVSPKIVRLKENIKSRGCLQHSVPV